MKKTQKHGIKIKNSWLRTTKPDYRITRKKGADVKRTV